MDGQVPATPEDVNVVCVPPVRVVGAVCEVQQLTHHVEERVEDHVEENEPHQVVRDLTTPVTKYEGVKIAVIIAGAELRLSS